MEWDQRHFNEHSMVVFGARHLLGPESARHGSNLTTKPMKDWNWAWLKWA